MASDGRCTDGTQIVTDRFEKICTLTSGALLGLAGEADLRNVIELLDRVKTGRMIPTTAALLELKADFAAILALPDGSVWSIEGDRSEDTDKRRTACAIPIHDHFAIGSGGKFAKAAMDMGASAERAVRIAIKNDSASGGRVHVLELKLSRRRRVAV